MRDKTRDDRYFILTLFAVAKELDRVGRQNIVDIGGYTTDVLLLRSGRLDLEYCRSLETGIITMNNEIIRKVNTLHDMMLEDAHIRAVVMGEKVVLPEEIKKTRCEEAGRHAGRILDQLRGTSGRPAGKPGCIPWRGKHGFKKIYRELTACHDG